MKFLFTFITLEHNKKNHKSIMEININKEKEGKKFIKHEEEIHKKKLNKFIFFP